MTKKAFVASTVFVTLVALILLGVVVDIGNNRFSPPLAAVVISASSSAVQQDEPPKSAIERKKCTKAQKNIVFLKTHKTASTTAASIFDKYAVRNNLKIAVPPTEEAYMHRTKPFDRDMVLREPGSKQGDSFNLLSCHARYNRREMDAVVPDAKYITLLRDPRSQFVSAFAFYHFDSRFERKFDALDRKYTNVLEEFFKDPKGYFKLVDTHSLRHVIRNQQFFDLGLDTEYADDWDAIDATIARLDQEIDLVMITEHFDESLILLHKVLCWELEDVLYVHRMVRNTTKSIEVNDKTRRKIAKWNSADMELYNHYNRTLWQRIADYGPSFEADMREFRERLRDVTENQIPGHRHVIEAEKSRIRKLGKRV